MATPSRMVMPIGGCMPFADHVKGYANVMVKTGLKVS